MNIKDLRLQKETRVLNLNELDTKPRIEYPLFWEYRVIFKKNEEVALIFKELLRDKKFSCKNSLQNGKYQSYMLSVLVESEEDRLSVFNLLKKRASFVL